MGSFFNVNEMVGIYKEKYCFHLSPSRVKTGPPLPIMGETTQIFQVSNCGAHKKAQGAHDASSPSDVPHPTITGSSTSIVLK
ncbi:hypothetical protein EUGRSUZ_F03455 [Eucalyptus grandis]|uniref:Uncharacterized protein n=2 Tax=Eucalyptus grandis TaxID=71139 RepID=A0ACC3KLB6_EUCGR|nr:hypothetical protein EUGRSUZ_F03455 [Eucalyptus grandis]